MAGYKFRLQRILDLKESMEEEKKNELGLALKRLEDERSKLEAIKNQLSDMQKEFRSQTSEGIPVSQLRVLLTYIEYYKKGIKDQKLKIKMAEDYSDSCREELIKASQEKKMMEKLKEIDYKKHLYNEQKKDDKLIDDLISFKEGNKA